MKYLKKFDNNSEYDDYINEKNGEVFLPNISYVVESNGVYYNPIVPNYFTGIVNAADATTSYRLFSGGTVGMNNIKTMKINDIEIAPVSSSTFGTTGNNSYFVDFKKPLTSTNRMFSGCTSLTSLDLSNFDTRKVTSAYQMFYNCKDLTSLDLSNFDTHNVTDMGQMFYYCSGLTSLDLSNFDTSNVTTMNSMFYCCSGLTSLDLTNFDTSNVTNMGFMFRECTNLTEVRMGGNPNKVSGVSSMFDYITTSGRFYYNAAYDYSKIIKVLPSTWTAVPCTLTDGVLIPN